MIERFAAERALRALDSVNAFSHPDRARGPAADKLLVELRAQT